MVDRIIVLSGAIASGKSELARGLCERFDGHRFSTRDALEAKMPGDPPYPREALQQLGEKLDRQSGGTWLAEALSVPIFRLDQPLAVIDSVRMAIQVAELRRAFGRRVVHVHLTASPTALEARFLDRQRTGAVDEGTSYAAAKADPTEMQVDDLAEDADVRIDTGTSSPKDVLVRVACAVGLEGPRHGRQVDVLVGGSYGSEGKGNIAHFLAPEYDVLVRGGGPNAGHTVYLTSGETYTHHHLPSGTRASEAHLVIAAGAVVNADKLLREISECGVSAERLTIDPQVMTISDEDIKAETALRARIGSTAQGVGHATARRARRDDDVVLAGQSEDLLPFVRPASEVLHAALARGERVCVEGTQGAGLSLFHGPYPYVTSRDTTAAGCLAEAGIAPHRVRRVLMVVRSYPIRVASPPGGTSGPLTKELEWSVVEDRAGFERDEIKSAELTSTTRTQRRVGEFEWDLLHRAASLNAPTDVALTFADYIASSNQDARRFEQLTDDTIRFIEEVERVAAAPVTLIATRFHPERSIIDRRTW